MYIYLASLVKKHSNIESDGNTVSVTFRTLAEKGCSIPWNHLIKNHLVTIPLWYLGNKAF